MLSNDVMCAQLVIFSLCNMHGSRPEWRAILRYMPALDATDARILLALCDDPRLSGVEIAQRLGLSRNTVQARLVRLESGEALAPVDHRVHPTALGYPLTAFVTARVDQHRLAEIEVSLAEIPEVIEVHGVAGDDDLVIRIVARDTTDLYRVAGQILASPGIERTDVALSMREMVSYRTAPLLGRATQHR